MPTNLASEGAAEAIGAARLAKLSALGSLVLVAQPVDRAPLLTADSAPANWRHPAPCVSSDDTPPGQGGSGEAD